jgi:hypothetical protein
MPEILPYTPTVTNLTVPEAGETGFVPDGYYVNGVGNVEATAEALAVLRQGEHRAQAGDQLVKGIIVFAHTVLPDRAGKRHQRRSASTAQDPGYAEDCKFLAPASRRLSSSEWRAMQLF